LLDTDIDFSRVSVEKGAAEAFFEFLAPDAISLPVGEFPIRGRDAIKIHLAAGPQGILAWTPVEAEVARSGDLGYTWGNYEFRSEGPDGKRQITYGKYISIWKKQTDGSWKVMLDGGNPSPPPTQRR
jgi:ketosteroid isomerase-like protein